MYASRQLFHLCKIFVDETDIRNNGESCFMWGGIFLPIDCDLAVRLGKVRLKERYVNSLHFSARPNLGAKEMEVMKGFINAFIDSNACFRAIVANRTQWNQLSRWDSKARLIGLLLSYPWVPAEGRIFTILSRPRLIFDRSSLSAGQEVDFRNQIDRMLKRRRNIAGKPTKEIADSSLVFADRRLFDELQLIDIMNGLIRISYLKKAGQSIPKSKEELHDFFLRKFPLIKSFANAERKQTRQRLDVWEFHPRS